MNSSATELLRYPIGKYEWNTEPSKSALELAISTLNDFPAKLNELVSGLPKTTLLNRYRPDGWTIAQVIHHLADSHMHSYIRFKYAVLEDTPAIKDYDEVKWAELPDASNDQIDYSLNLITALHYRWVVFLKELKGTDLKRTYFHTGNNKHYPLDVALIIYAWHCEHHLAHIKNALSKGY
mgnify:FL=1|jgi:hypothetical protein